MPSLGLPELVLIGVVVGILFGPGRLKDVGGALATSIRNFRHGLRDEDEPKPVEDSSKDSTGQKSER